MKFKINLWFSTIWWFLDVVFIGRNSVYILRYFNLLLVTRVILLRIYLRYHREGWSVFPGCTNCVQCCVRVRSFGFGLQENSHRDLFSSSHGALETGRWHSTLITFLAQSDKIWLRKKQWVFLVNFLKRRKYFQNYSKKIFPIYLSLYQVGIH